MITNTKHEVVMTSIKYGRRNNIITQCNVRTTVTKWFFKKTVHWNTYISEDDMCSMWFNAATKQSAPRDVCIACHRAQENYLNDEKEFAS